MNIVNCVMSTSSPIGNVTPSKLWAARADAIGEAPLKVGETPPIMSARLDEPLGVGLFHSLLTGGGVEFGQYRRDVVLDGTGRQEQAISDLRIR